MEEPMKVYLPLKIYNAILKDAELFEFIKPNNKININGFINCLLENYFHQFLIEVDEIKKIINNSLSEYAGNSFALQITSDLLQVKAKAKTKEKSRTVSFRIKHTMYSSIQNFLNTNEINITQPAFIKCILYNYSSKPRSDRERIIYSSIVNILEGVLQKKQTTIVTDDAVYQDFSPYALVTTKEEVFTYLLGIHEGDAKSIRLCKIKNVRVSPDNSRADFTPKQLKRLQMLEETPQYSMSKDDIGFVTVRLTPEGETLLNALALYRPEISNISGDLYTFKCVKDSAMQYFSRFGPDATIIFPESVSTEMSCFYKNAALMYDIEHYGHKIAYERLREVLGLE